MESSSVRETLLIYFKNPRDRAAVSRVGRLLYDLVLESEQAADMGLTVHGEMLAAARDLRYLQGYLLKVHCSYNLSALAPPAQRLARFAGRLARKLAAALDTLESELEASAHAAPTGEEDDDGTAGRSEPKLAAGARDPRTEATVAAASRPISLRAATTRRRRPSPSRSRPARQRAATPGQPTTARDPAAAAPHRGKGP